MFKVKINYKQDGFTYFFVLEKSFQILSSFSRVVLLSAELSYMRKEQRTELTGPVELLHDCFMLMAWDSPDSDFLRTAPS